MVEPGIEVLNPHEQNEHPDECRHTERVDRRSAAPLPDDALAKWPGEGKQRPDGICRVNARVSVP